MTSCNVQGLILGWCGRRSHTAVSRIRHPRRHRKTAFGLAHAPERNAMIARTTKFSEARLLARWAVATSSGVLPQIKEPRVLTRARFEVRVVSALLFARVRLLLARFRRALMLRSRFRSRLSGSCLRSRLRCGLGARLRCLSWMALWRGSVLRTRLLRRFRGMFDRCRLALRSDRSCRPGCGSGFGFVDRFRSWARFGSGPRGCGLCLRSWSRLVFIRRTRRRSRMCGSGRLSSRHRTCLVCVHRLCPVRRNRMIEVRNRGCRFRQGRMRWRSVIYRRKVGLVLTGQMFLLHLCVHRSIALLARRGKLGLVGRTLMPPCPPL